MKKKRTNVSSKAKSTPKPKVKGIASKKVALKKSAASVARSTRTVKATKPAKRVQTVNSIKAAKPVKTRKPVKSVAFKSPSASTASQPSASKEEMARVLNELKELRAELTQPVAPPQTADHALEASVDSLRRLLSDLIDQHNQWILSRLIPIRNAATNTPSLRKALDQLFEELGAIRFRAQSLDHVDPLVHCVVEERPNDAEPEGVILETLQPGFRTGGGTVLAKAEVAVGRRN